jgi:hypothetical protein
MRRVTTYPGAIPLEVDVLNGQKNTMIAIGHVLQDMLGTSTLFSGLGCVPTAPAGMTVNVNPGRAYSLQSTDSGAYSSLSADSTPLVKQGILLAAQNFSCPAPTTAGFSINYLVQGAFQEVDGGSTVLPFYNASNPAQAYSGPGGTGTSSNTYRDNTVQLSLKTGAAATTGSQITPTPDAGFTGLWVISVPYGATTITSGNISQYSGAPFLSASLLSMIQQNGLYAVATGTANAHVAAFNPPVTTRTDGMVLRYKAPAANTGALTFNDGLGAVAVVGAAHSALQGGETAANGDVWVQWNSSIGGGSYVLIDSTGGAVQVAPATQSQHAVQLQQVGHGQCRLVYTNATTITLLPFNGQNVIVNGIPQKIPQAGIAGSNGGLSASTFYYVYLTSAGTLAFSATGHSTASNGVETMTGDVTKTLVGAVLTNASSQFSATNNFFGVISWFNRQSISLQPVAAAGTLTSTTPVEINSNNRVTFISWLGESVLCTVCGFASDTISQAAVVLGVGFNSSTGTSGQIAQANTPFAGAAVGLSSTFTPFVGTENQAQFTTPLGQVSTGSGSFNIINSVTIRG